MQQKLLDTTKHFGNLNQHVLVIGDVMLDRYLMGDVSRISPEAPVPVVLLKSQHDRAGGAANVAANLALLGIKTHIIGCVGDDGEATILLDLIAKIGIDHSSMIRSNHRPTIAKTRILSGHQQMMRLRSGKQCCFHGSRKYSGISCNSAAACTESCNCHFVGLCKRLTQHRDMPASNYTM